MDAPLSPMPADRTSEPGSAPAWRPLDRLERRVLGALVEKAKTTPDAYPLTLNALLAACNQKNNRDPVMQLEADRVEPALERLRQAGAVTEVQGSGRVAKYRHNAYGWLGVDKVELAVMAELLLRGAQTIGELRGRAARMEPIADVAALRPVVDSLVAKNLVVRLTPEGRGMMVCHNLLTVDEMKQLRAVHQGAAEGDTRPRETANAPPARPVPPPFVANESAGGSSAGVIEKIEREIQTLRLETSDLRQTVEELRGEIELLREELSVRS